MTTACSTEWPRYAVNVAMAVKASPTLCLDFRGLQVV